MIEPFAENRTKRPTHCKVMPAESKIAHFSYSKKKTNYKQKYNQQFYIYIPPTGHNATFYLKINLHKHILNRFSYGFMKKKIETVDRCIFDASIRVLGCVIFAFLLQGVWHIWHFNYQEWGIQSTLVISTSFFSNNRLSRSENLARVLT